MFLDDLIARYHNAFAPPDRQYFDSLRAATLTALHRELAVLHLLNYFDCGEWFEKREEHILAEIQRRRIEKVRERQERMGRAS